MATRIRDEVQITCYPQSAIPYRKRTGVIVADILGERMNLGAGDAGGLAFEQANPTVSVPWLNGESLAFQNLVGVEFIRFLKDGTVQNGASAEDVEASEMAGFILQGRVGQLDCKMENGNTIEDGGNFDLTWKGLQGTWKTGKSAGSPAHNFILNTGADVTAKARTKGDIPESRSLLFEVAFTAKDKAGPQPGCRLAWGGLYSIVMRNGAKPTIEKKINGAWSIWRTLDGAAPVNTNGGRYQLQVRRIAGRLLVAIGPKVFHFIETRTVPSRPEPVPTNVAWPAAPLEANAYNVRVNLSVSLIKYADAADAPLTGAFSRVFTRRSNVDAGDITVASAAGWTAPGAVPPTVAATVGTNSLDYTCTLQGSAEGIDTPFISKVVVRSGQVWTHPTTTSLDIAPATVNMSVSQGMPPYMPGAEVSIKLDRTLLPSGWETYVGRYQPVDIQTRTEYDDGTFSDWTKLFGGYIYKINKGAPGVNDQPMVLTCRDPILRLQKPAAPIDHRYPPLDLLLLQPGVAVANTALYGGQCVQEILRIALGPFAADDLNGNGDPERYFNSHYPLLDAGTDAGGYFAIQGLLTGQPPTTNGFFFPPPFGEDALGWINKLAAYDHAVFFYGWPNGYEDTFPVPVYGRILNIISGRPTWDIPDARYVAGDENKVMLSAETDTRPDSDINRVLVWAKGPGKESGLEALLPAVRMAEDRLKPDDLNAPENTWERTLIIREEIGFIPTVAEGIAAGVLQLLRDVLMQFPRVTMRGQARMQWGDKLTATQGAACGSDDTLGLAGQGFRIERVEHSFNMENGVDFTTTAWVRPLSSTGF